MRINVTQATIMGDRQGQAMDHPIMRTGEVAPEIIIMDHTFLRKDPYMTVLA